MSGKLRIDGQVFRSAHANRTLLSGLYFYRPPLLPPPRLVYPCRTRPPKHIPLFRSKRFTISDLLGKRELVVSAACPDSFFFFFFTIIPLKSRFCAVDAQLKIQDFENSSLGDVTKVTVARV